MGEGGEGGELVVSPGGEGGGGPDLPAGGGEPNIGGEGGALATLPGGLSFPGSLKINIKCGATAAEATLSLNNWGAGDIELSAAQVEGAFTLSTTLPLTIGPGESAELVVSTAPGVVGTDAPGDERKGALILTSNLGTALVQLDGVVAGTTLEVNSVPGAPLTGPLPFACNSTSPATECVTQTFTIVNTGTSNAVLKVPFSDRAAVAAFVPGSAERTLEPGSAVRVEVRPAAQGTAPRPSTDALFIPVEGSCELEELEVPLVVNGVDDCVCRTAPPGIEASAFDADYACDTAETTDITIFNGSPSALDVTGVSRKNAQGDDPQVANVLPLSVASGQSAVLKLIPPRYPWDPGFVMGSDLFKAALATTLGEVLTDVRWRAFGASVVLQFNATGVGIPSTLALSGCAPMELALRNFGNGPATVTPPIVSGGLSVSGISTPQTIPAGGTLVFSVAAVSSSANSCATTGGLDFALDGNCSGERLARASTYFGACSCDGI